MSVASTMRFRPVPVTEQDEQLRAEVRSFLSSDPAVGHGGGSERADRDFSIRLARQGYVGMALPRRYGGLGRSAVERWIVTEELLAADAPIYGHWIADRQTGPLIARFGSEALCEEFIPSIARGTCWFAIGMSEPDSGSDLASVRTRAAPTGDGWLVNGTKIWTSGAQHCDYAVVLCRTSERETDRHAGLSQVIVDLRAPGVIVNPIKFHDGTYPFNELVMTDVAVPARHVLGQIGHGWAQVTSELAYERSGPDRYMFVYPLIEQLFRLRRHLVEQHAVEVGRLLARLATLRQLSLCVARLIDVGRAPAVEAALVKDFATVFEADCVDAIRRMSGESVRLDGAADAFEKTLARAILHMPVFTVAGGTSEVLRSVASKGL